MMTPLKVYEALGAAGTAVTVDGEALRIRPGSPLSPALLEAVRAHKSALLEAYSSREPERVLVHRQRLEEGYPHKRFLERLEAYKAAVDDSAVPTQRALELPA